MMKKNEFEEIKNKIKIANDLSNNDLVSILEKTSLEFDITKNSILSLSMYLDELENIYNYVLKEYENRTNVRK